MTDKEKFEIAMKCINRVDDFLEYRYIAYSEEGIRVYILDILETMTKEFKDRNSI